MICLLIETAEIDDKTNKIIKKDGKIIIREDELTLESAKLIIFRLKEGMHQIKKRWLSNEIQ